MNTPASNPTGHQIYPKRYFDASPTWFKWNKVTATTVHALRQERGFEGQNIYFHLNHPIQYVCLVGLIVDIDLIAKKYLLITIDDSSGACMVVKTELRVLSEDDDAEYPSNTIINSVDCIVNWGLPSLFINKEAADIGTVVKLKGTLDSFRNVRQMRLERAWIVKDTNEEVKGWAEVAKWHQDVLSKPWKLSQRKRTEIDHQINQDLAKEREAAMKKRVADSQHAEKKRQHLLKIDARRKKQEEKYDAGALPGSHMIPQRITDG